MLYHFTTPLSAVADNDTVPTPQRVSGVATDVGLGLFTTNVNVGVVIHTPAVPLIVA